MTLESIVAELRDWPAWLVYAMLFGSALIEYLVPPLPGDTFVVAGCVLVAAFDWHPLPVLLVVTAGAVLGAWLDFRVGLWLVRTGRLARFGPRAQQAIAGVVQRMRERGPVYLAVNRFVPALRAFFFVAAGIAGLRTSQVLLWSGVSALAWNILLVALGYALGTNLDALETIVTQYAIVVWSVIGALVVVVLVRWWLRRRRARQGA